MTIHQQRAGAPGVNDAAIPARPERRGFSLIEMIVAIAILGFLVLMLVLLERDLVMFDRKTRVDLFSQPNTASVLHRLRRDVLDSWNYRASYKGLRQSPTVLLLDGYVDGVKIRRSHVIIWDFTDPGIARRIEYADDRLVSEWSTNAQARFEVESYRMCDEADGETVPRCSGPYFVYLKAYDAKGNLVVDEKVTPALMREDDLEPSDEDDETAAG